MLRSLATCVRAEIFISFNCAMSMVDAPSGRSGETNFFELIGGFLSSERRAQPSRSLRYIALRRPPYNRPVPPRYCGILSIAVRILVRTASFPEPVTAENGI